MTGLDRARECMTECLLRAGVHAVTAWSREESKRPNSAVVAVSLRGCQGAPGGFQDYLGERYNTDAQRWEEIYGRRAKLTFGLDIYASGRDGAAECQSAFDALAGALQDGGPVGLSLAELSRGEVRFDEETGLFRCPAQAVCDAYLYAVTDENGSFLDFEVRGGRKL